MCGNGKVEGDEDEICERGRKDEHDDDYDDDDDDDDCDHGSGDRKAACLDTRQRRKACCDLTTCKLLTRVCRPSTGPCDVEERCNRRGKCPKDKFAAKSLVCRSSIQVLGWNRSHYVAVGC